jgi:hypothetical protein
MLYREKTLFINGEDFEFEPATFDWLCALADQRRLTPAQCEAALKESEFVDTARAWLGQEWIDFG